MKSVLVVDDEVEIINSLSEYLEDKGFSVLTCGNADEAYTCYLSKKPDLIISDIKMPGRSGIDLFKQLQSKQNEKPPIPFVLMTSYSDIIGVEKAFSMGVSELIAKPFDLESLNLVLNYLLELDAAMGAEQENYFAVPIQELTFNTNKRFEIYLRVANKYVLVAKSDQEFAQQRLNNYYNRGINQIYMNTYDFAAYADMEFDFSKNINTRPLNLVRRAKIINYFNEIINKSPLPFSYNADLYKLTLLNFENSIQLLMCYEEIILHCEQLATENPISFKRTPMRIFLALMIVNYWMQTSPALQCRLTFIALFFNNKLATLPKFISAEQIQLIPATADIDFSKITSAHDFYPHFEELANNLEQFLIALENTSQDIENVRITLDTLTERQMDNINLQVLKSLYLIFNLKPPNQLSN